MPYDTPATPCCALQKVLRLRVRRTMGLLFVLVLCALPMQRANANIYYCTGSSVTYSPALTSTMYYSKSYASTIPVVVYSGTASWTLSGCSTLFVSMNNNLSLVTGTVINAPGLTVAGTGTPGVTTATCVSGATRTMTDSSSYTGFPMSSGSCTYIFPFTISTNSSVDSASGGTSTAAQLALSNRQAGWIESGIGYKGDSTSTIPLAAQGIAITFIPRGCTATAPSQTVTLPNASLGTINTTGYSAWTTWSFSLNSCTAVSSAITAKVTFSYTELDGTGSGIIAPTGGTATHVGVQLGYGGNTLANGTATSLGAMSSATSYTYTMQARYAKASGQTATAGTISGASATYVMTYN